MPSRRTEARRRGPAKRSESLARKTTRPSSSSWASSNRRGVPPVRIWKTASRWRASLSEDDKRRKVSSASAKRLPNYERSAPLDLSSTNVNTTARRRLSRAGQPRLRPRREASLRAAPVQRLWLTRPFGRHVRGPTRDLRLGGVVPFLSCGRRLWPPTAERIHPRVFPEFKADVVAALKRPAVTDTLETGESRRDVRRLTC